MNKLNFKMLFTKILFIFIIFTPLFLFRVSLAAEALPAEMATDIDKWLNEAKLEVREYTYKDDNGEETVTYAIVMPEVNEAKYPIKYESGRYVYLIKDENGDVAKKVPFDVNVAMVHSESENLPTLTKANYKSYLTTDYASGLMTNEDGEFLKVIGLDDKTIRQMAFVVELDDGTFISSNPDDFNYEQKTLLESFWDKIVSGLSAIWDWTLNKIAGIINTLLLAIADGIQSLIDSIFDSGEKKVTIYRVIFGKIDKLSINYWGASAQSAENTEEEDNLGGMLDNAPAPALKTIVSYWYGVLRGIAVAFYLVMLLYIGVRILLSSTGKSNQKYKEMFKSWVIGIIILGFYPYVMRYVVIINDALVTMIDQGDPETNENAGDTMIAIRDLAEQESNLALTVVYIIMLVQLIILLGVYYKRAFMTAFLITIFPIVAVLYIWEESNGKAKALVTWTREYVVVVFTQLIHAVIYVVLIDGAFSAFRTSKNWFIFVLSVLFLFEAEKIIRAIFGLRSSANTIGDLATAGATAWAATRGIKAVFKRDGNGKSKDEEDKDNAKALSDAAKKGASVSNQLAEKALNDLTIGEAKKRADAVASNTSNNSSAINGGSASNGAMPGGNSMENLAAAQALMAQEALNGKTKRGILHKALDATAGGVVRSGGIILGLTSGMAAGSMGEGFANAAIGNEVAGIGAKGLKGITGVGKGYLAGKVMKAKVKSGAMDDKLREVGFDIDSKFDEDETISKAKAQIFRDALAAQGEYTRRGGKVKGDLEFLKELEKGRKRENL